MPDNCLYCGTECNGQYCGRCLPYDDEPDFPAWALETTESLDAEMQRLNRLPSWDA